VDLREVGELAERVLVSERNEGETVVSQSAHGGEGSGFLTTTGGTSGNEDTGRLAPVTTASPDTTGLVPEGLPLGGEVSVTGGDTEEDGVVLEESVGLGDGVVTLWGSVHLGQDLLGESLGDPVRRLAIASFVTEDGRTNW
jgi:hypothetical protein